MRFFASDVFAILSHSLDGALSTSETITNLSNKLEEAIKEKGENKND